MAILALGVASVHCGGSDSASDTDAESAGSTSGGSGSSGGSESGGSGGSGAANGGSASAGGGAGGEDSMSPGDEVTFEDVKAILSENCSKCHSGTNAHVSLQADEGLYARLTSEMGSDTKCAANTLVVPGDVASSVLVAITSPTGTPPCSVMMPNKCSTTGSDPRSCLNDAQLATISTWIADGALE